MSRPSRASDVVALASDVSLAIAGSPDLDDMLSVIARRVVEAFDVWECDIYEYRPETDALAAAALWARDLSEADRAWLGTVYALAERRNYRSLIVERRVQEYQLDDPRLPEADREVMEEWGERSVLSTPLIYQGDVVGALTLIEKRTCRRFGPADFHLLELISVPAAVAVYNGRMLRRSAEQNRSLQALLSASRAMTSTIDLDELLATIARVAGQALETAECAIDIYDPEDETIAVAAYYQRQPTVDAGDWIGRRFSLDEYPGDRAILFSGEIVEEQVSDRAVDVNNRQEMEANGEKTQLTVPMHFEGRPLGLLAFIELEQERHFSTEERVLATALGEQAAAAISNAWLLRRSQAQKEQVEKLLESSRAISSSVKLQDVLAVVARTTAQALGAEQCQIQDYDALDNTVTPIAFWQSHADRPEPGTMNQVFSLDDEPEERALMESGEVLQQLYSDPDMTEMAREGMRKYGDLSYLNVPLVFNDQPFGLMVLVETERERRWTDEDIALARALADQAAVAIEHARLYERVQAQAVTDGLTGLYNHRHFYERLEQEIARARRYGTPVSLLMIDIDDFKAFNDRHGHVIGDAVLRKLAAVLRSELRQKLDVVARYGGEEFTVILPNTPIAPADSQMEMDLAGESGPLEEGDGPPAPGHRDGAERVADRIRRRVAETVLRAAGDESLTVSIGVAVYSPRTSSPEDLVANADAALYKAKRAGKDRVETYG